jgi:hypothetical protein
VLVERHIEEPHAEKPKQGIFSLIAGVTMILSSAAHAFLGWKGLGGQLAAVPVPPDLLLGVKIGCSSAAFARWSSGSWSCPGRSAPRSRWRLGRDSYAVLLG